MPTILIASLEAGAGRTTATAAIGALFAEAHRAVRLLRVRAEEGEDAGAEDDAAALAAVPQCGGPASAVSAQEAQAQVEVARAAGEVCVIEAPPGPPEGLPVSLGAKAVLVSAGADDGQLAALADASAALGDALAGVVITRQPERGLTRAEEALRERGLTPLAVLPEDRLLAGASVREMAETLRASRLVEAGPDDEAVEFVMLGPISSDPGQPYFQQHENKAVVNRFDKMDLHLAALAAEPQALILTGGQMPSPYLLDRVGGSGLDVTVLLAPEGTVRTIELLDDLYVRTRFSGSRKLARAVDLLRPRIDLDQLAPAGA